MGRQIQIGILEVPDVVGQNVQPDHVGPEHIILLFGGVDAPPAGHAENVEQAGNTIEPGPPAAVQPNILAGQPPAASRLSQCGGACDFCNGCDNMGGGSIDSFYEPYINGEKELRELNEEYRSNSGMVH